MRQPDVHQNYFSFTHGTPTSSLQNLGRNLEATSSPLAIIGHDVFQQREIDQKVEVSHIINS